MIPFCRELFVIFVVSRFAVRAEIFDNKFLLGETGTNFIHHFPQVGSGLA
jgi:hypothetical protein